MNIGGFKYYPLPLFFVMLILKIFGAIESWWLVFAPLYPLIVMIVFLLSVGAKFSRKR